MSRRSHLVALALSLLALEARASAQLAPGTVARTLKISNTQGGFAPYLHINDQLGRSVAVVGDLDGNGVIDLASGALGDDDGGIDQGAAYVMFLRPNGSVLRAQKISALAGGFTGDLDEGDQFGRSIAGIGDLDGDGVGDLAVGANYDDDGGSDRGGLYLLMLNRDGTVKRTSKISSTQGGFTGPLRAHDEFGRSVTSLGDLDGDGVIDLAVGAPTDGTGGTRRGAIWILFLRTDGTVKRHVKIASGKGGFTGRLKNLDWFAFSLANLGDFDGDGVVDLAVGAALDDDGAVNAGAVWLLYLRTDGTVKDWRKISMLSGGFTGLLESPDQFGTSVAPVGDLNGDGITELAVGTVKDGDGGAEKGAVYVLFLTAQGTVAFHQKISALEGNFPRRALNTWDWLGSALAPLGDFDKDGVRDVVIGARNDDDGGSNSGALYLTSLTGSAAAMALAGPAPERGSPAVDLADLADGDADTRTTLAATHAFGHGPEPEGNLALVEGDGSPGTDLTFRLPVPAAFAGKGAEARLLVSTRRHADPLLAERTGLLLDTRTRLGTWSAVAAPTHTAVEITLSVPPAVEVEGLAFQAVWRLGRQRAFTDAVELSPTR